ncbi:MAG: hypothetical protein WC378_15155 [Opitutaceae bacterium]
MRRESLKKLRYYGGYVRKAAARSIRKRKRASTPGEPPSGHGSNPVKHGIRYAVEPDKMNVVIGAEKNSLGNVLDVLEHGGMTRRKNRHRTKRKPGDGGEVAINGRPTRTTKAVKTPDGKTYWVTFGHIYTHQQAARANRLQEMMYGPEYTPAKRQYARPFMAPAQARSNAKLLPDLWKDSIR